MEFMEDRKLNSLLSSFSCAQDQDIEAFLHNRAMNFERLSKSRTYLIVDEHDVPTMKLTNVTIYGYFSLALKVLSVPDGVSNRLRKEIDGFSAKYRGQAINYFPCYLIGQLARNSTISASMLKGDEIISMAHGVISAAVAIVGGPYAMIECKDNQKLINFYSANGYQEIARIPDNGYTMVQMITPVY